MHNQGVLIKIKKLALLWYCNEAKGCVLISLVFPLMSFFSSSIQSWNSHCIYLPSSICLCVFYSSLICGSFSVFPCLPWYWDFCFLCCGFNIWISWVQNSIYNIQDLSGFVPSNQIYTYFSLWVPVFLQKLP